MRPRELVMYVGAFTGPLAGNAVFALLGTFSDLWGVSSTAVLLTIPVFMFPFAFMQIFSGTISDAYDRRKTIMLGFAVYAAGGFAAAFSNSFGFFMFTRLVQGVGFAFVQPVMVAALSEIAGRGRQGLVMGYYGSFTTAGIAVGPLAAGLLAEVNWRLTFVLIGGLAVIVMVAIQAVMGDERTSRSKVSMKVVSAHLGSAIRNRDVVFLAVSGFLAFVAFIGIVSFVSEQLGSGPLHLGPSEIGFAISVSGIAGVLTSPYSGRMVDKRGARSAVLLGFLVSTASCALLVPSTTYPQFVVLMGVLGFGTSFVWAALLTMSVRAYPTLKGTASSIFNSARFFGYALSPILLSPVFVLGGFSAVIISCTGLSVLGMAAVYWTRRGLDEE